MNLPNQLTVARFILTAVFLVTIFSGFSGSRSAALIFFVLASLTDFFDGRLARARGLITNFGILMDPLADKILTCSAFIAFVELRQVDAWMVVIIVARELAITGLRLLAASRNSILAAEGFGKHKTASQIATIVAILVLLALPEWSDAGGTLREPLLHVRNGIALLADLLKWLTVGLTLLSGGIYLWRNRSHYLSDL